MTDYPRKINLTYIDQVSYLQGLHRSGWPYVMAHLMTLQNDSGVLCDTYVDRTFMWANLPEKVIPYSVPWIGFVHHTFNTTFSSYNNVELLKDETFLSSLPQCKGLFVFSQRAASKWKRYLARLGYDTPVVALIHPTQFVKTRFSMDKFKANEEKKIVQVGAWLRDNYAIYRLNDGKPKFYLEDGTVVHKAALIGPKMDHYFKPFNFFRHFRPAEWKRDEGGSSTVVVSGSVGDVSVTRSINGELPADIVTIINQGDVDDGMCRGMCRDIMCRDSDFGLNKYVLGAIQLLKDFDNSVITYPTMSDADYDTLLSENIVFLDMIDAAAVNTLQECIVRNTPIVVNPLPAIVEVLGESYPLYFDDLSDAPALITLEKIKAAYEYLVNMDKDFLRIATFMKTFTTSDVYRNL